MFERIRSRFRRSVPPAQSIRESLFGDLPLEVFPPESAEASNQQPWLAFVRAREALGAGRTSEAIDFWHQIIAMKGLESRHYTQAWHFLRQQGVTPPLNLAKVLLGVVVEVPVKGGLDLLAAYADHHARYFNFSGAGVIWEHPDETLDSHIDTLLTAGARILQAIGLWSGPRPPSPPPAGQIRINLLLPAGLHFAQGPTHVMATDSLMKPGFDAATALMQQLINRARRAS